MSAEQQHIPISEQQTSPIRVRERISRFENSQPVNIQSCHLEAPSSNVATGKVSSKIKSWESQSGPRESSDGESPSEKCLLSSQGPNVSECFKGYLNFPPTDDNPNPEIGELLLQRPIIPQQSRRSSNKATDPTERQKFLDQLNCAGEEIIEDRYNSYLKCATSIVPGCCTGGVSFRGEGSFLHYLECWVKSLTG